MGTFSVNILIFNPNGNQSQELEAMVDTGATYSVIPQTLLLELEIAPLERATFELADNSIVEYEVGDARMQIGESARTVPVTFAPEGTTALLGATALGIFRLAVDPVKQELMPAHLMLK